MDDREFQDFLKTLSGLGTTATNKENSNIERGAFGLPLAKKPEQKQGMSLTESPTGKLPVIKQATQLGVGIGTTIGKAGLGLGQTFLRGANVVSNLMGNEKNQYNPIIQRMEEIKTGVFEKPFEKEMSTFGGKAGQFAGDIALFAQGNATIAKGQQFLSGVNKGLNVTNKVINYGLKKTAQVIPEAIGMGGIQYAISGGDKEEATTVGVASGLLSGLTHVGADAFRTLIPQTVKEAVGKVFIPRGKIKLSGTENITDDAVGALQTIKNLSPEIKVVDADGIEKVFVPEKATLLEMPQVLLQAKDKIYKAYTELATKAGEAGVSFGQKDFNSVIADLSKYEGKGYTISFSNKAKQIQEAINRYGTFNPKDGRFYFNNTELDEIQTLIEAINKDVNLLSDKAGSEVALETSRKLREILDDKILNATGEGYQQLRNAYRQLKSIEPEVINEFKKALRGQGIQADIIDKIATVDTITGILSGNPAGVARGLSWEAVKIAWRKALGKEANLQRAFKIMGKAEKENPALAQRLYGNPTEGTPAFKVGEEVGQKAKEFAKNPKIGLGVEDITKFKNPDTFVDKNITPLKNTQWTILTGENPMGKQLSEAENKALNDKFLKRVKEMGYEPIPVEGHYGGNPEHSFLLPNMTDADALKLAKEFNQESALTPKGLIYQDGTVNPSNLDDINFDGNQTDFYSKINIGGRDVKFSIPIDFEKKVNLSELSKPETKMITLYHASPKMPKEGNWKKDTYFADTEQNARYYAESHHKGKIDVRKVEIPENLVQKNKTNNIYQLKEEYPITKLSNVDNTLIEEAKKYKSAEEFVKAQKQNPIYKNFTQDIIGNSKVTRDNLLNAPDSGRYAWRAGRDASLLLDNADLSDNAFRSIVGKTREEIQKSLDDNLAKYATEKNIVPPTDIKKIDAVIKYAKETKSQLEEIWNKANIENKFKSVLREGQQEIGQTYNTGLVARERFDIPSLKKISFGGSDRDVYDLGDDKVLKIAKSSRGLDQNASSADYYAEDVGLIPKTLEVGDNYLVKEKVLPPDANTKKMVKELDKLDIISLVGKVGGWEKHEIELNKAIDILNKYGYSGDDLANYSPLWGDMKAIRNWGTTVEGKPILLDEGTLNGDLIKNSESKITGLNGRSNFNDPEFRKIYNLSRTAKKKFGDIDKKTMYGAGVVGTGGMISK